MTGPLCLVEIKPTTLQVDGKSVHEHYLSTKDFRLASQNSKFYRPIRVIVVFHSLYFETPLDGFTE